MTKLLPLSLALSISIITNAMEDPKQSENISQATMEEIPTTGTGLIKKCKKYCLLLEKGETPQSSRVLAKIKSKIAIANRSELEDILWLVKDDLVSEEAFDHLIHCISFSQRRCIARIFTSVLKPIISNIDLRESVLHLYPSPGFKQSDFYSKKIFQLYDMFILTATKRFIHCYEVNQTARFAQKLQYYSKNLGLGALHHIIKTILYGVVPGFNGQIKAAVRLELKDTIRNLIQANYLPSKTFEKYCS